MNELTKLFSAISSVLDSLVLVLGPLPCLRGMAQEEGLKLGGVIVGGNNEMSHLMQNGVTAVTKIDIKDTFGLN